MEVTDEQAIEAVKIIKQYCKQKRKDATKIYMCDICLLQPVCDTAMDSIAAEYWPVPKEETDGDQ